jgi:hypothetical protein
MRPQASASLLTIPVLCPLLPLTGAGLHLVVDTPRAPRPQDSTSAIVTLASSGITRPAQLDGKTYASYGARFEGRIVQQLIRNDGGAGDFKESTPPMLGIWDTLLKVGGRWEAHPGRAQAEMVPGRKSRPA